MIRIGHLFQMITRNQLTQLQQQLQVLSQALTQLRQQLQVLNQALT